MTSLRLIADDEAAPLAQAVVGAPWMPSAGVDVTASNAGAALLVVTESAPLEQIRATVASLGMPTLVVGPGIPTGPASPLHEIRLRPQARTLGDDVIITDRVRVLDDLAGDVLVTANIAFTDLPVARWDRDLGAIMLSVGTEPSSWSSVPFLRLVHRLLHLLVSGDEPRAPIRVGLLGYGAIGHEHAAAVRDVDGLDLALVCDVSPDRLAVAEAFTPGVRTTTNPEDVRLADDVDLVVVSTPPNTHGQWAIDLIEAGKHVVLEKPMALTVAECDAAIDAARRSDRLLVVYQNRRFDPDFRAIAELIEADELGEVFHLEAFVGAHQHPCNYWHSDAEVSGGALFDWGSHIVDQILQLMPGEVATVTARNHKRTWHDVTNADHSRMTLHYADGREATFIYSDLAAALKPRWYIAGTRGGVIGDWRRERVIARTPIGTLDEDVLAPADSPPEVWLHGPDGRVAQVPGLPAPRGEFHRQLAEWLRDGMPMTVTAEHSRRVVAMLEAAEESARREGAPVAPVTG